MAPFLSSEIVKGEIFSTPSAPAAIHASRCALKGKIHKVHIPEAQPPVPGVQRGNAPLAGSRGGAPGYRETFLSSIQLQPKKDRITVAMLTRQGGMVYTSRSLKPRVVCMP